MKVRPSVQKMCPQCQIIRRGNQWGTRVIVRCKTNPKHNQTQPIKKKRIRKF